MTWIKTVSPRDDEQVRAAMEAQRAGYPPEYGPPAPDSKLPQAVMDDNIVLSHSLIPDALRHSFGALGAMFSPDLPLSRRQHEMIAATVSSLNRCFY